MPLNAPGGSQDEAQESAAASEGGAAAFDGKTLKALLRMHGEDVQRGGSVVKSISRALSLSEKEITKAITARVRTMREDAQYLLGEIGSAAGGEEIENMRRDFADDAVPMSLQQITSCKERLVELLAGQGRNAGEMLEERFKERRDSPQHREQERVIRSIEVAFLIDDVASNRKARVREALETAPPAADPESALAEMRNRLFALLSPKKQQEFSLAQKLDVLRGEAWEEREQREYDRLSVKILGLFGRSKGEAPFHTQKSLAKALREEEGVIKHILGRMNQEGQIGFMMGAAGEEVYMCRDKKMFSYMSDELIAELDPAYFDRVGAFLRAALDQGDIVDRGYLEDHAHELKLPADVAAELLDCYVDVGQLKRSKDRGYQMVKGNEKATLSSTAFERVSLSRQFYELATALNEEGPEGAEAANWDTIEKGYRSFRERWKTPDIPVETRKPTAKVLHFTEAQLGHKDFDEKALQHFLEVLRALPEAEKPDVIVVSGLLFGRHRHWEKDKHRIKPPRMEMNTQLRCAKFFLDQLRALGVPVVYNMSDNDALIVKEYTYDAVSIMESILRGAKCGTSANREHLERGASYWQFEQAQRSKAWPQHFQFQWEVVFPYMLRSGRHLRSAEEVREQHGEYMEEYLLLLYAYKKLKDGESLERLAEGGDKLARLARDVLEIGNIPFPGNDAAATFRVTSDFTMDIATEGRKWRWEEKHFFRQTPTSRVKDPLKEAREDVGQRMAAGEEVPRVFAVEGESHGMGSLEGGKTLVLGTPGLHRVRDGGSSYTYVSSDEGTRKRFPRGERYMPGVTPVTLCDDGRICIDFWNERFLEKMGKTSERMAAVMFSDWQTGSVTSRPDLYTKALDYTFHRILPAQKTYLFFNGDIIQGRNYPEMPNENCDIGLVRIDDQQLFVTSVLRQVLAGVPAELKSRIQSVNITPGNHEWNSGHKNFGSMHSGFLRDVFYDWLGRNGDIRYAMYSPMRFGGEYFKTPSIIEDVQGHKILAQHIFMEKCGKGSGGIPIYQFRELLKGLGEKMAEIDVMATGHFHHPSYHMANETIGLINGSIAGMSGYEWWRGYNPVIGTTVMYFGGGAPPRLEIITEEALHNYQNQGSFSDANLARAGFSTDRQFDTHEHGFGRLRVRDGTQAKSLPQSGLQKALWHEVDSILRTVPSK